MLIRASGYNTGAQEYLEQGNKSGREFSRDELDHRLILDGQLSVTREIYESIPDHGQDRYLTFTLSFKEDQVDPKVLKAITAEFKNFLMHAYVPGEFNFYAEAHLPKIKEIQDKKTGEMIQRKPHIHIIVPRINLLSGNEANPVDVYMKHEKHFEAFQEYINQNYGLASPREHVRADIEDAASVLSRYKADDFYGKNRQFKQGLVTDVIERGINTRADFYAMVAEHGETRIRNEGKENEYLAVKLPGDTKFTNLKETIFQDEFIVRRSLKKPPLDPAVIQARLQEWPQRSKEIKYIHKMASPAFRERYWNASAEERVSLLAEREQKFYQTYGVHHDGKFVPSSRDRQRGPAEAQHPGHRETADGVSDVSISDVAGHGQAEPAREIGGPVLLPGDAHLHLGQRNEGGDPGLRPAVPGRRGGRGRAIFERRGPGQLATLSAQFARERASGSGGGSGIGRSSGSGRDQPARRTRPVGSDELPLDARNPHRVRSMVDIEQRGRRLFGAAREPAAYLNPVRAGSTEPGSGGQPTSRKKKRSLVADTRPPDARNPHRVRSMVDIKQRGRRLFGAASGPSAHSFLSHADSSESGSAGQPTPRKNKRRFDTADPRPPHARNPHRVGSMADIKSRTRRLFASSGPLDPARLVKRPSFKPLLINRSASTVAAYFTRQAEQNQLMPAQRHALRRLNKQYFDLRRSVFSDSRLTRQDKTQLVSVLAFERLKAREAIQNPQHHTEVVLMGSAEIRNLIKGVEEQATVPGFSFTGPRGPHLDEREPEGVRVRVKRVLDNLSQRLDPAQKERDQARERELNAKDLYTRKATFSQNVHYLDKKTDKTLFVDTGKAIVMRRTGITEAGVAVALQLAKERFGSTLAINGTPEFKQLVVEAAAKNGIDVHFTDKAMNQALADRRAELEIDREGQGIAQPSAVDLKVMQASAAATAAAAGSAERSGATSAGTDVQNLAQLDTQWREKLGLSEQDVAASETTMTDRGALHASWLLSSAERPADAMAMISNFMENPAYKAGFEQALQSPPDVSSGAAGSTVSSELVKMDREWRENLGLSESEAVTSQTAMALRGEAHANWLAGTADHTPEAVAMLTQYLQDDTYRESFKRAIDDLYELCEKLPENNRITLDQAVDFVFDLVNGIERSKYGQVPAAAPDAADRSALQGILLEHGSAPYLHNEKLAHKPPSYFVTLQLENGASHTVWGVDLERVMSGDPVPFNVGDRIKLSDLGSQPVTVSVAQGDGSQVSKTANRRVWEGELIEPSKQRAAPGPVTQPAHVAPEPSTVKRVEPSVAQPVDIVTAVAAAGAAAAVGAVTAKAVESYVEHKPQEVAAYSPELPTETASPELGTDPRSLEDWAPDETCTELYVQVEEDGPEMD